MSRSLALTPDGKITWAKKARGRHKPGVMNKLEAEYASMLECRKIAGEITWYAFEAITLKLADDCRLTIDFFVLLADGTLEAHECKSEFFPEDGKIKLKVAAAKFPLTFWLAQKRSKKNGGQWQFKEY
jgi:hypothetical protein